VKAYCNCTAPDILLFPFNFISLVLVLVSVRKPSAPTLAHIISSGKYVAGVTSLGNQLFVVRQCSQERIEVYDATTFTSQPHISVPTLGNDTYGLASCAVNNCLYVSNWYASRLHKVQLLSNCRVTSWSVGQTPAGLSVNNINNVLVTCNRDNKLQEFTTQGARVREISLQYTGITKPWYAIQLSSGQLMVSHQNRVCVVDDNGRVTLSHGNTTAGSAAGQLSFPVSLVQVKNGCVLVADRCNNRIIILNSSLSCERELTLPTDVKLRDPWAVCLDESRGRLYISEYEGERVLVFDNVYGIRVDH